MMHRMKRLLFSLLILLMSVRTASAYNKVAVYVVAHQDDWQLFMGLDAYRDMTQDQNTKVVFIYTTAGDASCRGRQLDRAYYLARERGALNSIEFCMDTKSLHCGNNVTHPLVNNHQLRRYEYKNVVNYFLRLPDGCFGVGLKDQSLEFLKNGRIPEISAVDSSAAYLGWSDLRNTIRKIIEDESDSARDVTVNIPETDRSINPGDHPDHVFTGMLVQEAIRDLPYASQRLFVEYYGRQLPSNVSPEELALKSAIYAVAEFGVTQNNGSSNWTRDHVSWLGRNYSRFLASPVDSLLNDTAGNGLSQQFRVFPNPATDYIHICYKVLAYSLISVRIYNMGGHMVLGVSQGEKPAGGYMDTADLASLPAGNYTVRISSPAYTASVPFTKL